MSFLGFRPRKDPRVVQSPYPLRSHGTTITCTCMVHDLDYIVCNLNILILDNVEHCGGEPEQAATMATHE